jgi:hypothetical protein
MKRTTLLFILFLFSNTLLSQESNTNEFIIQINNKVLLKDIAIKYQGITIEPLSSILGIYLLKNQNKEQINELTTYLSSHYAVEYFNQNHKIHRSESRCLPSDSLINEQWALPKIHADEIWCKSIGGRTVRGDTIVIGVLEANGFDFKHKDLLANIATNKGEIPNNGLDDDGNGYVDDFFGISCKAKRDSITKHHHGTEVLGILGAIGGNFIGVSGVNQHVKMLMVSDAIFESDWIIGFNYFLTMRKLYNETKGKKGLFIPVINISAGYDYGKASEFPILCKLLDELGKVGILTVNALVNADRNVDEKGDIPADCDSEFLITVTNSTKKNTKYENAGYGKKNVDLAAPGVDIITTTLDNKYTSILGCSAAAPIVSGGIALLASLPFEQWAEKAITDPINSSKEMKAFILNGVNKNDDFAKYTLSGGQLDLTSSMRLMEEKYTLIDKIGLKKVFPNPANNIIHFKFYTNSYSAHQVEIYNSFGQIIENREYQPDNLLENIVDINIENYANGIYLVKLTNPKSSQLIKFMVLH